MLCCPRYNHEVQEMSLTADQTLWCEQTLARLPNLQGSFPTIAPLKVEASHRRFYRLHSPPQDASYVLMVSPPELEQNEQFVTVQSVFAANQVPVPTLIAHDFELGLFLMSDLGRDDLEVAYETDTKADAILGAIETLHKIQGIQNNSIPPYTLERLEMELGLFNEWFLGRFLMTPQAAHLTGSDALLNQIEMQPKCCIHRDYHCRNILYNESRIGVVDFQDALQGAALYDLASLLRDCYYSFSEDEIDHWLQHFLATSTPVTDQLNAFEPAEIRTMLDYTAIQRQLKAIGIFARLHLRDNKSAHLQYIAPLLERLVRLTASYPELTPLNVQLSDCIKPAGQKMTEIEAAITE